MFRFQILENKPTVESRDPADPQNTAALDLTRSTLQFDGRVSIEGTYYITDETAMRPDLVSVNAWGDDVDTDLILAFNKVSNPFAVDVGDIFFVPERGQINRFLRNRTQLTDENLADLVRRANETKLERDDESRQKFLRQKQKEQNGEQLPPNFVTNGRESIEPRDGRIVLGNTVSDTDCITGKTDAQIKGEIIRNRLKERFNQRRGG